METRAEYVAGPAPQPTWRVPLVDLRAQYLSIKEEIDEAIAWVLDRGNYVAGRQVEAFEAEWARFCGAKYAVGVSSCTDALFLTLLYLRTRQGRPQRVLTTPATFMATTQAIIASGNHAVLYDIEPDGNLNVDKAVKALGRPYLDAALPVHLYGRPAQFSLHEDFPIIEDAAQAHGQPLRGLAVCHSFYPTKNLGAMGQAGAVVTNDQELAQAVRELRTYGERERFVHHALTGNHRMDEVQAAILRVKMPHLQRWNEIRRWVAEVYRKRLTGLPGIVLPEKHPEHVWHIFAIRVTDPRGRDDLASLLADRGIQTAVRYPVPIHLQPAMRFLRFPPGSFPEAEAWARENLSLPMYPEITLEQVEYVAEALKEWTQCK